MKDNIQNTETLILERVAEQLEQLQAVKSGAVQLFSARMFAELLGCSESSVLKGAKSGAFPLPTHKIFPGCKGLRWDRNCVQAFIDAKRILALQEEDNRPAPPFHGIRRAVKDRVAARSAEGAKHGA